MGRQTDGCLLPFAVMAEKHGMTLFRLMATEFDTAIQEHDVQALERLGRAFVAEIQYKSKQFAKCGTGTSDAKRATAVANGARGGRPKSRKSK